MFMVCFHCLLLWKGRTDVSEQVYRPGRRPWQHKRAQFGMSQATTGSPRFWPDDGVLRQKMRWHFVFMACFHCLWVWKGRTDVSEQVYRPGRGQRQHKRAQFGVSQAAGSPRFWPDDGELRGKMRWHFMSMVCFHCLLVWKGRTDVSEQVYRPGRRPWQHKRAQFGVSQAAGSPRFWPDDGVLRRKMCQYLSYVNSEEVVNALQFRYVKFRVLICLR